MKTYKYTVTTKTEIFEYESYSENLDEVFKELSSQRMRFIKVRDLYNKFEALLNLKQVVSIIKT